MEEIIKSSKEIIRLYETEYDRKDLEQLVNESKEGLDKQGKEIVYKAMYYSFLMKIEDDIRESVEREMDKKIDNYLDSGMDIREAMRAAMNE